ncbi:MAG TPA: hypothetical protein VH020_00985, partial [Stellaceae bacterium]|nr:hypothetical protein [Stellaceae bacterium]
MALTMAGAPPAAAQLQRFDGAWDVSMSCASTPDGVRGFKWSFPAEISGGLFLGRFHESGTSPSATLSGRIEANGNAALSMDGITGNSNYNINAAPRGMPFHFDVTAHFDPRAGAGKRIAGRDC